MSLLSLKRASEQPPEPKREWELVCHRCGSHTGFSINPPIPDAELGGPWCWTCVCAFMEQYFGMKRNED